MKKLWLVLIIIFLTISRPIVCSAGQVTKRIEGIAEFLIERANQNMVSMFEEKINENPYIKQYFPNTSQIMKTFSLKVLMLNNDLWRRYVEKDLNSLAEVFKKKLKNEGVFILSDEKYKQLQEAYNPIVKTNKKILEKFNKMYTRLEKNIEAINYDSLSDTESLKLSQMFIDDSIKDISELLTYEEIQTSVDIIKKTEEFKKNLIKIKESYEHLQYVLNIQLSYSTRVSYLFFIFENIDDFKKIIDRESSAYRKFKNYVLFFAQLSDAKSSIDAKVVLKTFALPASSYKAKRKNEMHLSISAYLGLAGGLETTNEGYNDYFGFIAPVGIEYSWGMKNEASISILGTILDFGAVVNSQVYNITDTFDFKDISAPGLAIIYGFPNVPISIGIGGFKVNGLEKNSSNEQRYLVFIATDMPLFVFY